MAPKLSTSLFAHHSGSIDDAEFSVNAEQMYIKKENAFSIGFRDSPVLVVETLNLLQVRVSETIESFKPEFK
jgi:hypothetical protein